jgi:hypothetical protein
MPDFSQFELTLGGSDEPEDVALLADSLAATFGESVTMDVRFVESTRRGLTADAPG